MERKETFGKIRLQALERWNTGLIRQRSEGELSDDYSDSLICSVQGECTDAGVHCSFICSLGDWLDNISDLLHDARYDGLDEGEYHVLFRYYTRILLIASEVIEDLVSVNKQIRGLNSKKDSANNLEDGVLDEGILKLISDFINSICKHKTEKDNLHVHNHHLVIEFEDFGCATHDNQLSLASQDWSHMNRETTILVPRLALFIDVLVVIHDKFFAFINGEKDYRDKMFELYNDAWASDDDDVA